MGEASVAIKSRTAAADKAIAVAFSHQFVFEPGIASKKKSALVKLRQLISCTVPAQRTRTSSQFRLVKTNSSKKFVAHPRIKSIVFEQTSGPDHRVRMMLRTRPHPGQSEEADPWKPWRVGLQDSDIFLDVHEDEGQWP